MSLHKDLNTSDKDDDVQCPYDANHLVKRHKFQTHLLKCEVQHRDSNLAECRFNRIHRVPKDQMIQHERTCSDREVLARVLVEEPAELVCVAHNEIKCEEDWDNADAVEYSAAAKIKAQGKTIIIQPPSLGGIRMNQGKKANPPAAKAKPDTFPGRPIPSAGTNQGQKKKPDGACVKVESKRGKGKSKGSR